MARLIEIPEMQFYKDYTEDNREVGSNPVVCSQCNHDFTEDEFKVGHSAKLSRWILKFNYCPNCGAKFTDTSLVTLDGLLKRDDL